MSVHWLKLSQARGIATVLMYGERRRGTDKPKGYARGKVWLGACRKCSGFNGATHWWNSRTVNEYGYLMDNLSEAAWFCPFRSVFWAASYRFFRWSLPKRSRCLLCVQGWQRGVVDWWLLKSAIALVRLLSAADFNSTIETQSKQQNK